MSTALPTRGAGGFPLPHLSKIGAEGMAVMYEAEDHKPGRYVALKFPFKAVFEAPMVRPHS